jgi:uncharacterized phiE125 gp8 family phage protein
MLMWPSAISFPDDYYHRRTAHQLQHSVRVITPPDPSILPVSLSIARNYMRVEDQDSDELIAMFLRAAMLRLAYLDIAVITTKYALDLNRFPWDWNWPGHNIEIPLPPLQSIDAVKVVEPDGTEATVDPIIYTVGRTSWNTGTVSLAYAEAWPEVRGDNGSVSIEFTAGYTDDKTVPSDLKLAILMMANSMFDNRGEITPVNLYKVPQGVDELLKRYQPVGIS